MGIETILLLVAGGYLVYNFVLKKGDGTTPTQNITLKDVLSGTSNSQPLPTAPVSGVSLTKLVQDWERLRDDAEFLGLNDASSQLDEIWKMLNPKNTKKQDVTI